MLDAYACVAGVIRHNPEIMHTPPLLRPGGNEYAMLDAHACVAGVIRHIYHEYVVMDTSASINQGYYPWHVQMRY